MISRVGRVLTGMMGATLLLAANAASASSPPAPWASLTIKPSRGANERRIAIGTLRLNRDTRQLDYWMSREQKGVVQQADSRSCPAIRAVIGEMKHIEPMQPDPPEVSDKGLIVTADGTWYTLEGPGAFQNGHMGKFRMESNVGTPLAAWAQRVEEVLVPCWK